jgi:hypothetical protein
MNKSPAVIAALWLCTANAGAQNRPPAPMPSLEEIWPRRVLFTVPGMDAVTVREDVV